MNYRKIIISRTDSLGDVILTLPMAGILKKKYPSSQIIFLGSSYTRDIILCSSNIDLYIDWQEIFKMEFSSRIDAFRNLEADAIVHVFPRKEIAQLACHSKIPTRIGTTGRFYHYLYCNKLVPFTRRRSSLHEAQLNIKLLQPFNILSTVSPREIWNNYGFSSPVIQSFPGKDDIDKSKFNLIIHPKSKGSSREWGASNFSALIRLLPTEKFKIFITGTPDEGLLIKKELIDPFPQVKDMTGKLSLKELIGFINAADGLVAASTGPLHIAAALGKYVLGLYPPIRPMNPQRWAPIGTKAEFLVLEKKCNKCRSGSHCDCIEGISPQIVKNKILNWING